MNSEQNLIRGKIRMCSHDFIAECLPWAHQIVFRCSKCDEVVKENIEPLADK